MGRIRDLNIHDVIVVTSILTLCPSKARDIIGTVHPIVAIDPFGLRFLYLIKVGGMKYWVDGKYHSSLMMELL